MSENFQSQKKIRNLIRGSLLLLVLPMLYVGLWISISGNEALTYFEKVQLLMSYFPASLRDPLGISLTFMGMSLVSAVFGFYGYVKAKSSKQGYFCLVLSGIAILFTMWFGFTML
mgnify:CR=1 FL=1